MDEPLAEEATATEQPSLREAYPVGMLLDAIKVVRVESEWGLVCEVSEGVGGFVHVRRLSMLSG